MSTEYDEAMKNLYIHIATCILCKQGIDSTCEDGVELQDEVNSLRGPLALHGE